MQSLHTTSSSNRQTEDTMSSCLENEQKATESMLCMCCLLRSPVVGQHQVRQDIRPLRDNAVKVQRGMGAEVVILDVAHVNHAADGWELEEFTHVVPNIGIRSNSSLVGFEIHHIDLVKSNQRHEETDVYSG